MEIIRLRGYLKQMERLELQQIRTNKTSGTKESSLYPTERKEKLEQRTFELAIEALKYKNQITDIESDILKTWEDYSRNPFDREKAQNRITSNNLKYPDVFISIRIMPNTITKPFSEVTDEEMKSNLIKQLSFLFQKI